MRLTGYLDKGVSLGAEAPCLTTAGRTLTYFDVQRLSWRIARAFVRERLGGVKVPKQVEVWPDLPRSKVGKVMKPEIKVRLRDSETP